MEKYLNWSAREETDVVPQVRAVPGVCTTVLVFSSVSCLAFYLDRNSLWEVSRSVLVTIGDRTVFYKLK